MPARPQRMANRRARASPRVLTARRRRRVQLPYTALIWFGCYSLATISINMLTFRECPEAAASLLDEIREARRDLRTKGLVVG